MRWDSLFDDLEAQAAALEQAERAAEVEERVRAEVGALHLTDRLRGAIGQPLRVGLHGWPAATGRLRALGPDWLLLDRGPGHETLVALAAVTGVAGLGRISGPVDGLGAVERRLGLRHMLRGIARDRSGVRALLRDGSALSGTIDRVGADFAEVAVHPQGEARRRSQVREVQAVALAWLAAVRREAGE